MPVTFSPQSRNQAANPNHAASTDVLSYGSKDADYGNADPGAGSRGAIRQLQGDLQALGYFRSEHGTTGGYYRDTEEAVRRFQRDAGISVDGKVGPETQNALRSRLKGDNYAPAIRPTRPQRPTYDLNQDPAAPVKSAPSRLADVSPEENAEAPCRNGHGGTGRVKAGNVMPHNGRGRATTFANGHIAYKGWCDRANRQNGGIGAWGDRNAPTDYFCALPVGLEGGGRWWHNQKVLVTNPDNGKQVVVRVQDKGPNPRTGVAIDLSPVAMEALGGEFNGSMGHVNFEFARDDAPVGPVR